MNIFDGLNQLIKSKTFQNAVNPLNGPQRQEAQAVVDAAKENNWTPGQFLTNTANGVGNLAGAVASLPGAVFKGVTQPQTVPETVTNAVKQTGIDINNAFGQPVNPQTGQIQAPSLKEAAQNFYNDPVNAALNYSIVGGAAKDIAGNIAKNGAKDAVTGAETAAKTADTVLPGGSAADIPQSAIQSFNSRFTVPAKRAMPHDLNTIGTSQEILAHVKSGGQLGLDNVEQSPAFVTGADGIITKMTRQAVGGVNTEIPIADAAKTAQDYLDTKKVLIPADKAKEIVNDIANSVPVGKTLGNMNAQDAMDYARQLEEKAAEFRRGSTYLTPRPEMEAMGKAYSQAADAIMEQIDKNSRGVNIEAVKTPENMAALQQFSPRLAAQVQNAKNVSELRSTAAPFVRLSKMQDLTDAAQNSTMNKATNKVSGFMKPATVSGAAIGSMFGPMGTMAGTAGGALVDEAMGPIYNAGINKIREPLQNTATNAMLNQGGALSLPFAGAVKEAGRAGALTAIDGGANQVEQNGQAINNNNSHNGSSITQFDTHVNTIGDIPQTPTDVQSNPDGTASIANIYTLKDNNGQQLFMDANAIKNRQLQIDAEKSSPDYRYQPSVQMKVDREQAQLNTIKNFSESIAGDYKKALTVNNAYSQAIVDAKTVSKNILNYNGKFDDFIKQVSQENANLATQLKVLEAYGGINPNAEIKGSTLLGSLQAAQKADLIGFYNALSSTVGYTGGQPTPAPMVPQATAPAQSTPAPSGGLMDTSSGGLMGPQFSGGSPAIAAQ